MEIEHHIALDTSTKHNLVVLPKIGYFKERLIAIISITKDTTNVTPLELFEGAEKQVYDTDVELIRSRVSERLPLYMVPTVWIAVGSLPQLASGKLDRKSAMQWLTNMNADTYQRIIGVTNPHTGLIQPTSNIETTLRSVWARVLNLPEVQVALDRDFLSLGGDSISAMQVMGHCRKRGIGLGVQDILRSRSIPQLATTVKKVMTSFDNVIEEVEKPFDLSPIQSLWFQLPNQGHGHFNQSFYLQVKHHISAEQFRLAIDTLVSRHSMLRSRFACSSERGWQQRVTEDVATSYRFRHESVTTKGEVDVMIEDSQKCLNPLEGPLLAVDLYEFASEQHAFLTACHLVIDLVSWRLLLEELEEILKGETLLPPALAFQTWCQLQQEHADTLPLNKVYPPINIPSLDFSYWGTSHENNTYGNAKHESFELNSDDTALFLGACHKTFRTEPVEVLLASLIHSWSQVFIDRAIPAIFNEGHGREPWNLEIDVARTVGWFTTGILPGIMTARSC
jgi:aryl carrier-like protein